MSDKQFLPLIAEKHLQARVFNGDTVSPRLGDENEIAQ